jgi:hypothetical protein
MPNHAALARRWVEGQPEHYIPSPAPATTRIDETLIDCPFAARVGHSGHPWSLQSGSRTLYISTSRFTTTGDAADNQTQQPTRKSAWERQRLTPNVSSPC